jgi:DNA-binding MarR family transcriptional regulator
MQLHADVKAADIRYGSAMSRECSSTVLRAWMSLVKARRRLLEAVASDLKAAGMPALDICLALIVIDRARPDLPRPLELEKWLELPQYTTSRLLERMERLDLVQRKRCPVDARSVRLSLTPRGETELQRILPVYSRAVESHLGQPLGEGGAAALAALLDRIAPAQ